MTNKSLTIAIVIVFAIAIGAYAYPDASRKFGQILDTFTGDYFNVVTSNGGGAYQINGVSVITSSSGTGYINTSCNPVGLDVSQPASTTLPYDCAVSGITSTYKVVAQFASSSPTSGLGSLNDFLIVGAHASSTSGFVTLMISNRTGASRIPSATNLASSTSIVAFK